MQSSVGLCIAVTVLATPGAPAACQDAVPMLINYQGELRSPTTPEPVPDGNYDMLFRIYDIASRGTPLWVGTHSMANGNPMNVRNGRFSALLGSGNGNTLDASAFRDPDRWLEIAISNRGEIEVLRPRQRIASVPHSFVSARGPDAAMVQATIQSSL